MKQTIFITFLVFFISSFTVSKRVDAMINKEIKSVFEIETLTWESKGLWAYLLSRPDNWEISVAHLTKHFPAGKDKVAKMLRELNSHGLCERIDRKEKGRFQSTDYNIFEL